MSFEYIVEKNKKKTLTGDAATELAVIIGREYDTYDDRRRTNLDQANVLQNEIFFKSGETITGDKKSVVLPMIRLKRLKLGKQKLKCVKLICFIRF